jgi:hypothetical protein
MPEERSVTVPDHLSTCKRCRALYKLLVHAYASDHGVDYDADHSEQEHLCDRCGITACSIYGCNCEDVLCPHGRQNLRQAGKKQSSRVRHPARDRGDDERTMLEERKLPDAEGRWCRRHDGRLKWFRVELLPRVRRCNRSAFSGAKHTRMDENPAVTKG